MELVIIERKRVRESKRKSERDREIEGKREIDRQTDKGRAVYVDYSDILQMNFPYIFQYFLIDWLILC